MPLETKGVWEAVPMSKGGGYWVQLRDGVSGFDDDVVVADVHGNRPNDAKMLAAAPELYDALTEMVAAWEPEKGGSDYDTWLEAKAALAKARGHAK